MRKSHAAIGSLVGLMLTAPWIAIMFIGWRWAGLPFAPFDIFDELSRKLPGTLITRSIDTMVSVIRMLHLGATGTVAKTAEQSMAITLFLAAGAIAASLLFGIQRRRDPPGYVAALLPGIAAGVVVVIASLRGRTSAVSPAIGSLWMLALALLWGIILGRLRRIL